MNQEPTKPLRTSGSRRLRLCENARILLFSALRTSSKKSGSSGRKTPAEPAASGWGGRLLPAVLPALLVAAWHFLAQAELFPAILLPSPERVAERAWSMIVSGELLTHAGVSMLRVMAGFAVSSLLALALSFCLFAFPKMEQSLSWLLAALRVVPPLSLVPLLILWLGIDEAPKLAIVVLASFFPVFLSSLSAMKRAGQTYAELARAFELSGRAELVHVLMPGASPGILTGLRLGFGYAWRALVGAELIAAASGLGYLIEDASMMAKTDVVLVGILSIAVLGVACDAVLGRILDAAARPRTGGIDRLAAVGAEGLGEGNRLPAPEIRIENLTVRYADGASPVRQLSFTAQAGKVTAMLGRSGCGKSTLLKAVGGLLPTAGGRIAFCVDGVEMKPKTGFVFQSPALLPWKRVIDNAALGCWREPAASAAGAAMAALKLVGLEDKAGELPQALSGGQAQRVGLARALARAPNVLLLDEPFASLDALTRAQLQRQSVRIVADAGMTVLLITHDVREAVLMADEIVLMEGGVIAERWPVNLPQPRRITDPGAAALEEQVLDRLLGEQRQRAPEAGRLRVVQ